VISFSTGRELAANTTCVPICRSARANGIMPVPPPPPPPPPPSLTLAEM
jgi:hypothetical protein